MFCLPLQFWPEGNALHIPDQQEKLYSVSLKPRISGFRVCAAPRLTHRQFLQLSSHCSFSKPVLNKSTEMCLQLPNTASSEPTAGSEGHCRHRADTSVPHFCQHTRSHLWCSAHSLHAVAPGPQSFPGCQQQGSFCLLTAALSQNGAEMAMAAKLPDIKLGPDGFRSLKEPILEPNLIDLRRRGQKAFIRGRSLGQKDNDKQKIGTLM